MSIIVGPRPITDAPLAFRFPCLPHGDNAYRGCIGVGPCRRQETPRCLLGRWASAPYRTPGLSDEIPSSAYGGAHP